MTLVETEVNARLVFTKKDTASNPEHPSNAYFSILITLVGIIIFVNPIQPWNAFSPMISILDPRLTVFNCKQFVNVKLFMVVILLGILID